MGFHNLLTDFVRLSLKAWFSIASEFIITDLSAFEKSFSEYFLIINEILILFMFSSCLSFYFSLYLNVFYFIFSNASCAASRNCL